MGPRRGAKVAAEGYVPPIFIAEYLEEDQTKAKHTAARGVEAVNNLDQLGKWTFHVSRNPQLLQKEMEYLNGAA
jgi:hypothetical protein